MTDDRKRGLYNKFSVFRSDGKDAAGEKHWNCQYFVLDPQHDPHAVEAMKAYIKSCAIEYPYLAADLMKWIKRLTEPTQHSTDDRSNTSPIGD
jgi:hypothetical protein